MLIKKFACDMCKKEIEATDDLWMIFAEKKNHDDLEEIGDIDDATLEKHFCKECKEKILAFISSEKVTEPKEVVQANSPRKERTKGLDLAKDKRIAIELYNAGKPIGEIARSLKHTYQCIKNWVQ